MKTIRLILTSLAVVAAFGLIFSLSKCKKQHDVVVVPVHDTLKGKSITGLCTYPDYTGAMVAAPGTVISLYLGSSVSGSPVATAVADASGNYKLPYLLPNSYYLFAIYNTANANYKPINGINFQTNPTDPTYAVAMGSSNITKNLALATEAPSGNRILTIIKSDTIGHSATRSYVPVEAHSRIDWWTEFSGGSDGGIYGTTLAGGFSGESTGWGLTNFYFDEANPQNDTIKCFVQLSHIQTFEPIRDSLASGCVCKTLLVDTFWTTGAHTNLNNCKAVPKTDTAWYIAPGGSVVKYGKGYLAHGFLTAFYHSAGGEIEPPRLTPVAAAPDSGSWNGLGPRYLGPYSVKITKQIDMYFEFQGVNTAWNVAHTTFNKWAVFEGQFDFNRSDYYVKTTSLSNTMHVTPHIHMKGGSNQNF